MLSVKFYLGTCYLTYFYSFPLCLPITIILETQVTTLFCPLFISLNVVFFVMINLYCQFYWT